MSSLNDLSNQYFQLYSRHWPEFSAYLESNPDLTPPLLIDPPDTYFNQRLRLCIVGQETNRWFNQSVAECGIRNAIPTLMKKYKIDFNMGFGKKSRGDYFWTFMRELEQRIRLTPGAIVWNNLSKVAQKRIKSGRAKFGRVEEDIRRKVNYAFPVFAQELTFAQPTIVIFFTGPARDQEISEVLPGAEVEHTKEPVARVNSVPLAAKCFRTHHPTELHFNRAMRAQVLDTLTALCQ